MYHGFDLIEKIYFVRTGGSAEELKAAEIIKAEALKYEGVTAEIEAFPVDGFTIKKADLKFIDPDMEVPFIGVGMSGSTPEGGVDGDLIYINSEIDAVINDLEGKIVLTHSNKLVDFKIYKKLVEKKAAGVIILTGDIYKNPEDNDLDPYRFREKFYKLGQVPAICIRINDAETIVKNMPKKCHFELIQDEYKVDSHNVVAEIKGTTYPDEIVAMSAHFDSVSYSRGAWDNATGSACILDMLGYFHEHKPARTLRFVWCGSEEDGLLGSKGYCEAHKDELAKHVFNINVDMIGVTLGNVMSLVTCHQDMVGYINTFAKMVGFPTACRQGVYPSDSTSFADAGVPSMSFGQMSARGGAQIHSRADVMDFLHEETFYKTCDFIELFADGLVNSKCFPVEKEIPENLKNELDVYTGRKENKNPMPPFGR